MITCSNIAFGDQLGAQMSKLASLLYLEKKYGQKLVFYEELRSFRYGFQFYDVFNINIPLLTRNNKTKLVGNNELVPSSAEIMKCSAPTPVLSNANCVENIIKRYSDFILLSELENGVFFDSRLSCLSDGRNYDIQSGFGTVREWGAISPLIINSFQFKKEYDQQARSAYSNLKKERKQTVSIHFRRGDYLVASSLNLKLAYYKKAIAFFHPADTQLLVFSDDIEYCKQLGIFSSHDVSFVNSGSPAVDMCMMTLCDHNIIANSSFSFWGAMLNLSKWKKVVCPYNFLSKYDRNNNYLNGAYFPDDWLAIKNGNGKSGMRIVTKYSPRKTIYKIYKYFRGPGGLGLGMIQVGKRALARLQNKSKIEGSK